MQPPSISLTEHERLYQALRKLPEGILNAPGRFLYSELLTLDREGDFYLLGYNPGGDPDKYPDQYPDSLLEDIHKWGLSAPKHYNAYLDEKWPPWSDIQPGGSHFQRNVQRLFKAIDVCPRQVCASNLFFFRSKDSTSHDKWRDKLIDTWLNNLTEKDRTVFKAKELMNEYESVHWRAHKEILEIVKPKCVIAIGSTTYGIIKRLLLFKENKKTLSNIKNKGKKCYCYVAEGKYSYRDVEGVREMKLIGLPHFSFNYPELEAPIWGWIKEQCSS